VHRLLVLLFTLLFVAPLLAQEDMPEVARSLMEEAASARDAGRIDDAIAKYKRVIEVAPTLASAYVNLGALYYKQGKVADAYDTFVQGTQKAPADRTLLSNAAAAAQQLGKSADALTYIDRALSVTPRDAALHALRSTTLRALNRNDEALAAIQQAVSLEPSEAKYQFSLGNLLYALTRRDEAVAAYRAALQSDKNYLRAYYNLGAVLFELGRYDEALSAYNVALAPIEQAFAKKENVDPIHARAYANLGAIYVKQKQWQQAIDAYSKALRLEPANASAHYNLGFIYFSTNNNPRAEEEYRKALTLDANLPLAYLHLGQMALRAQKYDEAIKFLREGMPRFDKDDKQAALRTLGRAQFARGDRAGARATFAEAVTNDPNDAESLLFLGRIDRGDNKLEDARSELERAQRAAPQSQVIMLQRLLVARDMNDLAAERELLTALLARSQATQLRAELAVLLLRSGDAAAARKEIDALAANAPASFAAVRSALAPVLDALGGKADAAAQSLAKMGTPVSRGNAGLLLWQLGRAAEAKPHLSAARAAFPDWNEVTLAAGEIALADRNYDDAIELLASVKCDAGTPIAGRALQLTVGSSENLCGRAKSSLAIALLSQAAEDVDRAVRNHDDAAARRARQLADRASSLDNDYAALAMVLKGTADLVTGSESAARDAFSRALDAGLPSAMASIAKKNLEAAQPQQEPEPQASPVEPSSSVPRRTVVVFLPDMPAENEKKLAESITAIIGSIASASGVPLETELFRRAEDARSFVAANRERVGIVISNPEFVRALGGELSSRYQFSDGGRTSYRRVVVVRVGSPAKSLADLRGKSISGVDALGDDGVGVTTRVPDDLTAVANALFGKTEAALVSEANPLLAERAKDLRVVHTTAPQPMPVLAFAPMPERDRSALDDALRGVARPLLAPLQVTSVARIERESAPPRETKRPEITGVSVASLGLRGAGAPPKVGLRVMVDLPRVEIPENLLGEP
jgi:tetratricopeptide (TPR) repeat protein